MSVSAMRGLVATCVEEGGEGRLDDARAVSM